MPDLLLVGGNLVQDTTFRKRLAGRDAGVEVQLVMENLLGEWSPPESMASDAKMITIGQKTENGVNGNSNSRLDRDQLKVTVKIFLTNFGEKGLNEAVGAALAMIDTDHAETLFVALPVNAVEVIGIGSGSSPEQAETQADMSSLWRNVETLMTEKKVISAGVCDLHPPVFMQLYNDASRKPDSVQINLKSCCVVPEELSKFTKENKVTLLTHSDPTELISEDTLRELLYPSLGREAGYYSVDWVARYQVHYKDRGVLVEKRYLVKLIK